MPVEFQDYYKTLGVSKDATPDEIKKAFRTLARRYHPDVAKNKKEAEEKFKAINEAYEVLGNPESRKKFDQLGARWKQGVPPPPGQPTATGPGGYEFHFSGTGFSDFFEQFFGRQGGAHGDLFGFGGERPNRGGHFQEGRKVAAKGMDVEGDLLVTLQETLAGSVRAVSLRQVNPRTGQADTKTVRIRVPQGILEGQMIRVAGKGGPGINGGPSGDLFLRVRFAKDPNFRVLGTDLYYDLPLAPWEAVLGTTVSVPTLEQSVTVRIPAGSRAGQMLRVPRKGLLKGKQGRGYLYVVLSVETPSAISEDEKALWQTLSEKSKFNPRRVSP